MHRVMMVKVLRKVVTLIVKWGWDCIVNMNLIETGCEEVNCIVMSWQVVFFK